MTFHDLKLRLEDWWRMRRAVRHLRAIDNRLLADMGIERKAIADLVSGRRSR